MAQPPVDRFYTRDHEWALADGDTVQIGVTAHAVEQLGDVTLIDLPSAGSDIQSQERFGEIESVKAVSELFAPVSGEIIEVNEELESSPELINDSPYQRGWMIRIQMSDREELEGLMDAAAYEGYLGGLE